MPNSNETVMYYTVTAMDGVDYIIGPQGWFPATGYNRDYRDSYLPWLEVGNTPQPWNPE